MAKKNSDENTFPAKYAKVLGEEWMNECDSLDADELKKIVIESESSVEEAEDKRDADEKLKQAKEMAKELGADYKETIFYQRAKIKYAMRCLETKGQKV